MLSLLKNNTLMKYYFGGNRIEPCYVINDIGVDVDSLLHLDEHTDSIVAQPCSRRMVP